MYKNLNNLAPNYDVVIIGSGLAGLTAANRLATFGHKVLIIEQHNMIGGYATWFKRGKHIFDVALHAFPYGMKKTLKKYWSNELADRVVQLKKIRYDNPQFSFTTEFEKNSFISLLKNKFSVDEDILNKFFLACKNSQDLADAKETTGEFLEKFFPGKPEVIRLLLETVTYATGTNLQDPALVYAIIFSNFMQQGTCTFIGGTDLLLSEMEKILFKNNVDILLKNKVDEIVVEDKKVLGVNVNKQFISSRVVISNANLKATVLDMLNKNTCPEDFQKEAESVPLSVSVAQVYMGIKSGEKIPEIADILFSSKEETYNAEGFKVFPPRSISYSFYQPGHIRPQQTETEIVASMCANYSDWDNLSLSEYRAKKQLLSDYILQDLEKFIPEIRNKLDYLEVATPKTLERYTGHWQGASFGTKFPGFLLAEKLPNIISGLFHCGSQGIIMSGWLGAANCGAIAANRSDLYLKETDDNS